jgi:putative membrane protein
VREGAGDVVAALAAAGWGIAGVAAIHLIPMVMDAHAWRLLVRPATRPPLGAAVNLRWLGEAVSALVPGGSVGAEALRIRLAMQAGVPGPEAGASIVVNVTIAAITQAFFTGVGLTALLGAGLAGANRLAPAIVAGVVLLVIGGGLLFALLRSGPLTKLAALALRWGRLGGAASVGAQAFDAEVALLLRNRPVLMRAAAWRLAGWFAGALEIWVGLWALGHPAPPLVALALDGCIQAVRNAIVVVPGALGVQEGGFLVVGAVLGVPTETALALALIKRARELLYGAPGLIAWQIDEWRHLVRRGNRGAANRAQEP